MLSYLCDSTYASFVQPIHVRRSYGGANEPCAEDKTPGDGTACKGSPSQIMVCGECGILSDSSYVTGGKVIGAGFGEM